MTQIVCHRGACLSAPENTFASAKRALALGGSIIEMDIHQSADDVLYVIHDETVDRTTNGSGKISELRSDEIDRLDAGSWFDQGFKGERVPRLDEYLKTFYKDAGFYLEIKKADCTLVAQIVSELDIADRCFTCSFDPEMRDQMMTHVPSVRRMVHWSAAGSVDAAINEHKVAIVEFHEHDFDPKDIRMCQEAGLEVMFYTDRYNEERFKTALELSMDFVNIDYIEEFDRLRQSL